MAAENTTQGTKSDLAYTIMAFVYLASFIIISIFFGLSPLLFAVFAIIAAIFVLPHPELGLSLILGLTMIFERFFTLQPIIIDQNAIYKIYPLDLIIGLTIIGLLIKLWKNRKEKINWQLPEMFLLLFIFFAVAYFIRSVIDLNADLSVSFSTLKNYAFYPLLYFLTIFLVRNKKVFEKISLLMIFSGVGIIFFIGFGLVSGQGLWTEFTPLSTAGVRLLAGTHAFYLILISLIVLSLLAFKRFWNPPFITVVLGIWFLGILGSLMRHLWLALAVGVFGLLLTIPGKNKKILAGYSIKVGLMALTLAAFSFLFLNFFPTNEISKNFLANFSSFQERVVSISAGASDTSINWRFGIWRSALDSWMDNPLWGTGLGRQIPLELRDWKTFEEVRNLHNSPLAIMVQTGIIGFALFLAFLISLLKLSWNNLKKIDPELKPYCFGIGAGVLVFLFASLFQPYLETNLYGAIFWIFLGLLRTDANLKQS